MVTRHKDLHDGRTVWQAYPQPRVAYTPLTRDETTDIIVIGAGITGAMAAQEMAQAGWRVIILDRRPPLQGSTLATTALLQYEIDNPIRELIKKIGYEKTARAWHRSKLAVDSLSAKTRMLGLSCNLQTKDSLYLAGNVLDENGLEEESQLRMRLGLPCRTLTQKELKDQYGLRADAALFSSGNYTANPVRLAAGYLHSAQTHGAKIYSPAEVLTLESSPRKIHVTLTNGITLTARHVIVTTGYEVPNYLTKQPYEIVSTWAFATKPQPEKIPTTLPLIWEAADPYLYMRRTPDGRFICGGEDAGFSDEDRRNAQTAQKIKRLRAKVKKIYPGIDLTADYQWSGSFGETKTGLPLIGPIPHIPHAYAIMAFGGNGITFSRMGAEIIRGYIEEKPDPASDLFTLSG